MANEKAVRGNILTTIVEDGKEVGFLTSEGKRVQYRRKGDTFSLSEIPIRLAMNGWTRDMAAEAEFGYGGEHIYKKEFDSSKVNDATTTVVIRVSETKESFEGANRLGVSAVEVLSFEGRRPYDATDLNDMLRAIDLAVLDLQERALVPFVPSFELRLYTRIRRWQPTPKSMAWHNWLARSDFNLLEVERELYKDSLIKKGWESDLSDSETMRKYPDEPEPKY